MIHAQKVKNSILIIPQSVATSATATGRVDTIGFDYLTIDILLDSVAAVTSKLQILTLTESDDDTTYATWAGVVGSADADFAIPAGDTDDPQIIKYNTDLKGRKRYIKVTLTPDGTEAQLVAAMSTMSRAKLMPDTTTEMGVVAHIIV